MTIDITGSYTVTSGQDLTFDGSSTPYLLDTAYDGLNRLSPPALLDQGTIQVSSSVTNASISAFSDNTGYGGYNAGTVTVSVGGALTVQATGSGSSAYGNTGLVTYTTYGDVGILNFQNSGTVSISAVQLALGWGSSAFSNTGSFSVSANQAYGVVFGSNFQNSGTFTVTGVSFAEGWTTGGSNSGTVTVSAGAGGQSIAMYTGGTYDANTFISFTNSGSITAQYAMLSQSVGISPPQTAAIHLTNTASGVINGIINLGIGPFVGYPSTYPRPTYDSEILNSGAIHGAIQLSADGNDLYDGRGGLQTGGITLGGGADTVYLGNDGETVTGGTGTANVTGGTGNNSIAGGSGNDTLNGGGGNDTLTGGLGADTFLFTTTNGSVTISDFSHAQGDRIDLTGIGFTSLAGILAATTQSGSNAVIAIGGGHTVTLQNVQKTNLTAADFVLAPITIDGAYVIASGSTRTFDGTATAYILTDQPVQQTSLTIQGTLSIGSGAAGAPGVAVSDTGLSILDSDTVQVASGGSLVVNMTGAGSNAVGYLSASSVKSPSIVNQGLFEIQAVNQAVGASLGGTASFSSNNAFEVIGATAVGLTGYEAASIFSGIAGGSITNQSTFTVTGVTSAVGLDLQYGTVTNSGVMTVAASGGSAIGIHFENTFGYPPSVSGYPATVNNSGTITAQIAIQNDADTLTLTNSGTINGDVVMGDHASTLNNTGTINGNLTVGDHGYVNSINGTINGSVTLGAGTNIIVLLGAGNDTVLFGASGQHTVDGGAGVDTASFAAATSGITVDLTEGQIRDAAAQDIAIHFQNVIGSAFSDRLVDSSANNVLTGGAGADTFVMGAGGHDTITDFNAAQGDVVDLSKFEHFYSLADVQAAATQNGADTVISDGSSSITLKNIQASSLTAGDFIFTPANAGLHINVTYDASVGSAPAGFTAAVQAAVQYFESVFSNNITINIDVGWGEVDGQTVSASAVGESQSVNSSISYQSLRSALIQGDAGSPAAGFAALALPASDPTGGEKFVINSAEAKALGLSSSASVDGYVGLSSAAAFSFDPTNRAVSGEYDAVAVLEHEISEVMGRVNGSDTIQKASALDLFRYASANTHDYDGTTYGGFSLDGSKLLKEFNAHYAGGDGGDWVGGGAYADAFDNAATLGTETEVSSVDVRVMEALGYHVGFNAPADDGLPTSPLVVSLSGSLAGGQSLSFNGPAAVIFSPTSSQTGPSYTNSGTISDSGAASDVDVAGVRYDPNASATLAAGVVSTFTNMSTGTLTATSVAPGSDAVGIFYGPTSVSNSGSIQVTSGTDGFGVIGVNYTAAAGGALTVQASNVAVGLDLTGGSSGATASNAGTIQVTGASATGVAYATSLTNSGAIVATATGYGATSYGVYEGAPGQASVQVTNSGVITATDAIAIAPYGGDPTLVATILNTGSINGAVVIGDGNNVFNSQSGTVNGAVDLVGGSNSVTLGAENDTVAIAGGVQVVNAGGGVNTVSYTAATSGVHASLDLQGQAQSTGAGTDTLSNFQALVGSNYADLLTASSGTSSLTGGLGADIFRMPSNAGTATVTDFSDAQGDKIDLSAFGAFRTFADVQAAATQPVSDTIINLGGGASVTLTGVTLASLNASDFVLSSAAHSSFDLNGDHTADLVFRDPATGDWGVAGMSASGFSWHDIGVTSASYVIDGLGDFNGDGIGDVLFHNDVTGDWGYAAMTASGGVSWHDVGVTSAAYSIDGTGDFNGDGVADVLFRNHTTGDWGFAALYRNGNVVWHDVGVTTMAYAVDGTGDFNGDGVSDVLLRNHATGDWGYAALTAAGGVTWNDIGVTSTAYAIVGLGDFNGDGTTDVMFRNNATGDWGYMAMHRSGGATWVPLGASTPSYSVVATGDFNGDGTADVVFRNTATGDWGYAAMHPNGTFTWDPLGASSPAYFVA